MEILNNFIVFEGLDGSGTTTQLNILAENYKLTSPPLYRTFEPTDSIIGRLIRQSLRKEPELKPETLAYLFAADRNEHIFEKQGIKERCKGGELVVSDRYIPSSLVYQGLSCNEELPFLLNKDFPMPELIIFLDIEAEIAAKRLKDRPHKEIFEYLDFQTRARDLYIKILNELKYQGIRVEFIEAEGEEAHIAGKIWEQIEKMPIFSK